MKVLGAKKLGRQLQELPEAQKDHIGRAIRLNVAEGARIAKTLAPVRDGDTRDNITTEFSADGLEGTVLVIESDAPRAEKDKAYSVEHGRKSGDRGTTEGAHYMWNTRKYLAKKFKGRISRALKRAAKEVANG